MLTCDFLNFFPPVQPTFYRGNYNKNQSTKNVKQRCQNHSPNSQCFHITETGMIIVFCIFRTDRWRHTIDIMPSVRCFHKVPSCSASRCKQMRFAMEKEKVKKSAAREKILFSNGIENKMRQLSITQSMETI